MLQRPSRLVAMLPLIAAGCVSFEPPVFNDPDGANDAEVLVVPFSESPRRLWYTESRRGARIAGFLEGWALREASAPLFVEEPTRSQVIESVTEDWLTKPRITAKDWKSLAGGLGIRYVVVGDIAGLELRRHEVVGMYRPTIRVRYEVFDALLGRRVHEREFSEKLRGDSDIPLRDLTGFGNDAQIEEGLLRRAAERIGKELYGYHRE